MECLRWRAGPGVEARLASVDDVARDAWAGLYAQMAPERRERCRRYRRDKDKARCVLADTLARETLHALTGAEPAAIVFAQRPGGKPYAPGLEAQFSLSHSGSLVLCAAAPFPVGADIQRHKSVSNALLHRAGVAGYEGRSPEDFFAWWTAQEASGKLTGRGLSLGPLEAGLWWAQGRLDRPDGAYSYSICARSENVL